MRENLQRRGYSIPGEIRVEDYIAVAIEQTGGHLFALDEERFTHAIMNPPYKKINGKSATCKLLNSAGSKYQIFMPCLFG